MIEKWTFIKIESIIPKFSFGTVSKRYIRTHVGDSWSQTSPLSQQFIPCCFRQWWSLLTQEVYQHVLYFFHVLDNPVVSRQFWFYKVEPDFLWNVIHGHQQIYIRRVHLISDGWEDFDLLASTTWPRPNRPIRLMQMFYGAIGTVLFQSLK